MHITNAGVALTVTALFGLSNAAPAPTSNSVTFHPNLNLTDTSGNPIQAHGGAIIQDHNADAKGASLWYWFGQNDTTDTNNDAFRGVSCYRSTDFVSWDYLGLALAPQSGTNISRDSVVERPKVLYNKKNKEYVMWLHDDNSAFSNNISGPYKFQRTFQPLGHQSRDMTVWQDPDTDEGYLIFATDNNANLAIASLNSDYTDASKVLYNFTNVYWEAPGVIKDNDTFYLLVSPQNGWTPTPNLWMSAKNMSGPWSKAAELAPSNAYTYLTQNAYDIPIIGTKSTTYVYFGDRWNGNELFSSTYSFLPLLIDKHGSMKIHNTGGWTLEPQTGAWKDLPYATITAAQSTSSNLTTCSNGCVGGKAANMTSESTFSFVWKGPAEKHVVQILYTYLGPRNAFLNLGASVNGVAVAGNVLLESTMVDYAQQAPIPLELKNGDKVVMKLLNWDGNQVLIEGVDVY